MGKALEVRDKTKREIKNTICKSIRQGANIVKACQEAGIDRASYYRWLEHDVHFRQAIGFAKKARIGMVEDALYQSAVTGDVSAQKFFLTNRDPENWKEKGMLVNQGIIQQGGEGAKMMPFQIQIIGVDPNDLEAKNSPEGLSGSILQE